MKYRSEIDGLRALAVLPVIFFHAGFYLFQGGFVGVDIFFVISGYLITTIIISELAEDKFSIVNFYERRARRILPALFFMMLVCLPFSWFLLNPSNLKDFGQSLIAVSTFLSNILFWRESGYFETASELKPLLHTWSLAIEEQYYIMFPIFLMISWRLGIKIVLILLGLIFILSLGISQWGALNHPNAAFFLLPTRGWELLIGVFAAFYLKYNDYFKSNSLNQLLSLVGFGMIIYSIFTFDKNTLFPGFNALIPTIGTVLLILSAVPNTFIHKLLSHKLLVSVGLISYSAYLWHQPILAFTHHYTIGEVSNLLIFFMCALSFIIAWFSWQYVEKPFRDKAKSSRSFIFKFSLGGIIFFSLIGHSLNVIDGGLRFMPPEQQRVFSRFINSTEYVVKRHNEIRLKEFDKTNNKKDILIIGDSFSEDIVNAVFEADLDETYEFSSYYIPVKCGVLFVENKSDREHPRMQCEKTSFYDNNLQKLILSADEVWIASAWKKADLDYMELSLKNIIQLNNNLTIFGSKSFGSVSQEWYEQHEVELWSSSILEQTDINHFRDLFHLNNSIRDMTNYQGINFINTQELICDDDYYCQNYLNGDLISHDGGHLTPFGAKILGMKLNQLLKLKG